MILQGADCGTHMHATCACCPGRRAHASNKRVCLMRSPPQVGDLLSVPLGTYFDVPEGVLPEATHEFYKDPVLKVS